MPDYTVSGDVDSMLRSANDAAIRSAIGVGTTDAPTFLKVIVSPGAVLTNGGVAFGSEFELRSAATNTLMGFWRGNSFRALFGGTALHTCSLGSIGFSDTSTDVSITDTLLWRDAAGILAQRNGSAKQVHRVYNTFLGTTANEWGGFDWLTTTNTMRIGTEHGGTGQARPIDFVTGGTKRAGFTSGGNFDVIYNLSTAATFYFGASFNALTSPSAGVVKLSNLGETDFGRLQLGGTTSAFPAIKRNGTGIDIRLADDSGPAPLSSGALTIAGNGKFTGTYPYVELKPSAWANPFYFQSGVTIDGSGTGDYTVFLNPSGKGFNWIENNVARFVILPTSGNIGIGTTTPASKLQVTAGDIEVETVTSGIILKAAGTSTRYRLTLNAGGTALVFTAV